jgi:hypothetical protein
MDALRRVREASDQIVQGGAVMAVEGSPATYHLVGALRWTDDQHVLWFVAHGDSENDAHALSFDQVQVNDNGGLSFMHQNRVQGYLSPIAHAQVEDRDDYRIGWQIWHEVAPLYENMIARAFDSLEARELDPAPRSPVQRRARRTAGVAA